MHFSKLKMDQPSHCYEEEKEQERQGNIKSFTLLNLVSPNVFDLGTLLSEIFFKVSQKSSKKPQAGTSGTFLISLW